MESRSRYIQIALFAVLFFMFIVVMNNILSIGDKFGDIHVSLEIWILRSNNLVVHLSCCGSTRKCFTNAKDKNI